MPNDKTLTKGFLTLLTPEQHAALTAAARSEGVSMGAIVRDAVDVYLRSIGPVDAITFEVSAVTDDGADMPTE